MGEKVIAWVVCLVYRVFSLFPQQRKIAFLSRQSARPFDFALLEPTLEERFPGYRVEWCCVSKIGRLDAPLVIRQLWHTATSELCLVDGYVPAISLPRAHRAFVVQLWHAPGAIKKFGYQALDTPAGRLASTAESLRMHRGYDIVIAGTPGAVKTFSQAFDMPEGKIFPLGLPRIDYLRSPAFAELRATRYAKAEARVADAFAQAGFPRAAGAAGLCTVLYAPTFRKGNADERWFEHAVHGLREAFSGKAVRLIVAGHPLDEPHPDAARLDTPVAYLKGTATIDLLHMADYVVTDYSTVAYEAGYADRPVLFFVPDIDEYRRSPGLNIDPLDELPTITSPNARELAPIVAGERSYDAAAFSSFMERSTCGVLEGAIGRICALLEDELGGGASRPAGSGAGARGVAGAGEDTRA